MSRLATFALAAAGVIALFAPGSAPASAQAVTRIDTGKVVGGATMSVEKGVRVWRGLPPAAVVVINPGGRTPVTVNNNTTTIIGGYGDAGGYAVAPLPRVGYGWGGWGFGRYGAKRHHPGFIHVNGRAHSGPGPFVPGRKAGGHHGGHH